MRSFRSFKTLRSEEKIPDPCSAKTFAGSKLQWNELTKAAHAVWLGYYQQLLKARTQFIVPLLKLRRTVEVTLIEQKDALILIEWNFGSAGELYLTANLADKEASSSEIKVLRGTSEIFRSSTRTLSEVLDGKLPPWSVIWSLRNGKN